jgi:ribosomal protein S18 acetylase RimI-like enzyme
MAPVKTITLCAADSNPTDLVAELMLATNPALWMYLFDGRRADFERYALGLWQSSGNHLSHDTATAAVADGKLLGVELGYAASEKDRRYGKTRKDLTGLFDMDMLQKIGNRNRELLYIAPYIPASAYTLQIISVAKAGRKRGIGRLLLENAFEKARKAGMKSLHLDAYADNPAIGFYQKMGMRILVETRVPHLTAHDIGTQYRLVKQL